jgi:pimeloyl-ACP methyl ester carboxylesterase
VANLSVLFVTFVQRSRSIVLQSVVILAVAFIALAGISQAHAQSVDRPTVVLVHGAFAESSSFNRVTAKLLAKGYKVIAVAIPLRGLNQDATYLQSTLETIKAPIILVGHSYGGTVITVAAAHVSNVKALVYVSGLAPDVGESTGLLANKFPGSTLGPTLAPPVPLSDGSKDLYILQDKYHAQFAADVSASEAALMATTQRPIVAAAFDDKADAAAWKTIPSWFLYGSLDKNIPPAVHAFMAQRANAVQAVEIQGASHVVMISHPDALVKMIDDAANTIQK